MTTLMSKVREALWSEGCPTNKIRYTSRAEAQRHARSMNGSRSRLKAKRRAYVCNHCGAWHLSTAPKRKAGGKG